jgi:hypothetical protein
MNKNLMESSQTIKIMSIGPAGGGKSCLGNILIGIPGHFKSGKYVGSGLTKNISSITRHAFGDSSMPKITQYDSPGLCDIELSIFNII